MAGDVPPNTASTAQSTKTSREEPTVQTNSAYGPKKVTNKVSFRYPCEHNRNRSHEVESGCDNTCLSSMQQDVPATSADRTGGEATISGNGSRNFGGLFPGVSNSPPPSTKASGVRWDRVLQGAAITLGSILLVSAYNRGADANLSNLASSPETLMDHVKCTVSGGASLLNEGWDHLHDLPGFKQAISFGGSLFESGKSALGNFHGNAAETVSDTLPEKFAEGGSASQAYCAPYVEGVVDEANSAVPTVKRGGFLGYFS